VGTIRWNEDLSRLNKNIQVEYVELTDLSSLIRAINKHRPDVISHLAAQSWVPYSFQNPIYTMETNAIGTLNILEAVRIIKDIEWEYLNKSKEGRAQIRANYPNKAGYNPLIHICSSSEFYGKVPKEKQPITENHSASPMNPYGVGKVAADLMSQLYEKYYDMRILITRMFTHTSGRRTMMSAEHFYAKRIAEIEADIGTLKHDKEYIIKLGNMDSIRTWRDARDAVTDYYKLFKTGKTGIYNISGDTTKSIQEVLDYLLSISKLNKSKIKFETDPNLLRKVDVDIQLADTSKFKDEIEQTKNYTFEETMQDILNSWRQRV
jgi:GDPmannose 4,6-dehydratase